MNGNAYDGVNKLKRMEFEFKNVSYVFDLNPETYDFKVPNRVNVHYTKAGAVVDLFGAGLKELNIVGITGFKGNTEDKEHGYKKYKEIKKLMLDNMNDIDDGRPVKDFLKFYNHTDGEAYITVPIRFNMSRNVNQPLLYKYDIQLYILRRVGDAVESPTLQVIGNPLGSPNTVSKTIEDRDIIEKDEPKKSNFSADNLKDTKITVIEVSKGGKGGAINKESSTVTRM